MAASLALYSTMMLLFARSMLGRHVFTVGRGTAIEPVAASHRSQGRSHLAA